MPETEDALKQRIADCRLCAADFALTATAHAPRPVVRFQSTARILIAGQAPGLRVQGSGIPFDDRSGDRLRDWLGLSRDAFYDRRTVAVLPMGFCFPGYDAKGSDLPPPPRCAQTWRSAVLHHLPRVQTTLLIGRYALDWHLGPQTRGKSVTQIVQDWRRLAPAVFVLPHPSWRNNGFLRRNPWFETDLLPALRQQIRLSLSAD